MLYMLLSHCRLDLESTGGTHCATTVMSNCSPDHMNAWSELHREELMHENPHIHKSDLIKQLEAKWKDTKKHPYINEAKKVREKYMFGHPGYRYRPRRKKRKYRIKKHSPAAAQTIAATGCSATCTSTAASVPVHPPFKSVTKLCAAKTMAETCVSSYCLTDTDSGISSMSDSSPTTSPVVSPVVSPIALSSCSSTSQSITISKLQKISPTAASSTQSSSAPPIYIPFINHLYALQSTSTATQLYYTPRTFLSVAKNASERMIVQHQPQATAALLPYVQTHHHHQHHHQQAQAVQQHYQAETQPPVVDHAQVAKGMLAPSVCSTEGCSDTPTCTSSCQFQDPDP